MVLKSYIFSYISGNYQQYTSDYTETFIKQSCVECNSGHQIAVHREGNLMHYSYMFRQFAGVYGYTIVCGEACNNLEWLFNFFNQIIKISANRGRIFAYNSEGRIIQNVPNFYTEAAELNEMFNVSKNYLEKHPQYWEPLKPVNVSIPKSHKVYIPYTSVDKAAITNAIQLYPNVVVSMDGVPLYTAPQPQPATPPAPPVVPPTPPVTPPAPPVAPPVAPPTPPVTPPAPPVVPQTPPVTPPAPPVVSPTPPVTPPAPVEAPPVKPVVAPAPVEDTVVVPDMTGFTYEEKSGNKVKMPLSVLLIVVGGLLGVCLAFLVF